MPTTPMRNVRVPNDRWDAAKRNAEARGTSRAAVVNAALDDFNEHAQAGRLPEWFVEARRRESAAARP